MSAENDEHVQAFILTFVTQPQKRRFLELLKSKSGRAKITAALNHKLQLDSRYARRVPASSQQPAHIDALLKALGAPPTGHLLSEWWRLDGREMPLREALEEVVGSQMGSVISCVPGRLAYYEGEEAGDRYVCVRLPRR